MPKMVRELNRYNKKTRLMPMQDWICEHMNPNPSCGYGSGALETCTDRVDELENSLNNAAKIVSKLVCLLHDELSLSTYYICDLLDKNHSSLDVEIYSENS